MKLKIPKIPDPIPLNYDKDVETKIETEMNKKIISIGAFIISGVVILILGAIIGALWEINSKTSFLEGHISFPKEIIDSQNKRTCISTKL